ncbi:MAG: molecular chaperone DnaK [Verrucomicrobiae bacterium]|nr:molecular chaperone DnaK [Verrucomicrobiae bacterium]
MSKIIGIDLGTTNSLVGTMDSGFPILIADTERQRITPSVANFSSEKILVGHPAKRKQALDPEKTVYSVKRFMGRRFSELSNEEKKVNYPVQADSLGRVSIPLKGKSYLPEEIASEILKKLKADAEHECGEPISRAVITVPAYFNDAQRNATKRASELAGLTVERILNEPTAAALAYGLDKKQRGLIAVYDLGGGTFDLSILELNLGVFEVRSTHGNTCLGGDDIDQKVSEFLWGKMLEKGFSGKSNVMLNTRLREEAERAKIVLSKEESIEIHLPFLEENFNFSYVLTRDELNRLAKPIIEKTRQHCLQAMLDAKIKPEFLDEVILVGGQTRMPLVRSLVKEIFGKEPNISMNPDEAVALGATLQAGILEGNVSHVVLLDVTPLSLGIETFGGLMNVIIPRNSTIPIKAGEMFTTAVDYQRAMKIQVLQGERELAKDNWPLGQLELEFEAAPRGVPRVGVQFEIDADGILKVLARDIKTSQEEVMELKSAIEVSDQKVEEMLADSLSHAFEDVSQRRWVEAELKAKEMLEATHKALSLLQNRLLPKEVDAVKQLAKKVSDALQSQELEQLKKANQALDEGTQILAEKMLDFATESLLQQKQ